MHTLSTRAKILQNSQNRSDQPSDLRIRKIPEETRTKELASARRAAEHHDDQALRRLALLVMEWGSSPAQRAYGQGMLEWRARLTSSQARKLLQIAWELQTNLERKAQAWESHQRVMALVAGLSGAGERLLAQEG